MLNRRYFMLLFAFLLALNLFKPALALENDFYTKWVCESCETISTGNFCYNCGAQKPKLNWTCPNCSSATGNICSNCGTINPTKYSKDQSVNIGTTTTIDILTEESTPMITTTPNSKATENYSNNIGEITNIFNYFFSPIENMTIASIIPIINDTYKITLANGHSYTGFTITTNNSYAIQCTTMSTSNYDLIEHPYDYNDPRFTDLLNYLMRKERKTIKSIIPMFGDIYSAQDNDGNSYVITISCSEAALTIGMIKEN